MQTQLAPQERFSALIDRLDRTESRSHRSRVASNDPNISATASIGDLWHEGRRSPSPRTDRCARSYCGRQRLTTSIRSLAAVLTPTRHAGQDRMKRVRKHQALDPPEGRGSMRDRRVGQREHCSEPVLPTGLVASRTRPATSSNFECSELPNMTSFFLVPALVTAQNDSTPRVEDDTLTGVHPTVDKELLSLLCPLQ